MEDFLEINLSDTGVGIPEKELDQVMKDYQQGSNTFKTPGQGLGLSLSRFLIEKQNGTFEVFSQEYQGTRIRILLPLVGETESLPEQTGVPKEKQESLVKQSSGLDDKAANASKDSSQEDPPFAKILVVDDEPLNLRLVENHLEGMNYELHCYQDGNQALESLNQDDPDLILLDLMMPGVDGYEVIKVIRSNYLQSQLPIIVITANQQEHVTRNSIQLGANDYLIKPYSAEELRVRINSQLRISKQQIMQEEMEMLQEREKKERTERLRVNRILDDLNISLAMVDSQGTILQINKEFQRMFGFSQSQAQGKQMKELLGLEEFEFKDKHSEISLRDVSGKRIKMSVRSNRVELQEQDEYIVIMIPAENSEKETKPDLTRFSTVNGDYESTEEIDPNELLRQKLCNLLNLSVKYYEYATGNNYTSLALDSGLWHATLNGTTYRAYMMERYMNPQRIPGKFKWGVVIKTAEWVL
ncbi:MAG: response regulator [SAR324 cluster bacterium]|nr:response regulator [SAR324 cluster bacterium]